MANETRDINPGSVEEFAAATGELFRERGANFGPVMLGLREPGQPEALSPANPKIVAQANALPPAPKPEI